MNRLIESFNNMIDAYLTLIGAEERKDDYDYDRALNIIRKERKKIDFLSQRPNIEESKEEAIAYYAFLSKMASGKNNEDDLYKAIMKVVIDRIKSINYETTKLTSAIMKDIDKQALIYIKNKIEQEQNEELKEYYREFYYLLILNSPTLEKELIDNPSLLNVPNSNVKRYKLQNPENEENINYYILINLVQSLKLLSPYIFSCDDYFDMMGKVYLESAIKSLLSFLPKKMVIEFRSLYDSLAKGADDVLDDFVSTSIKERLTEDGYQKVVSIIP